MMKFSKYLNKKSYLFFLLLLLYAPVLADDIYHREVIFETAAKKEPLNLPLFCLRGTPSEWPSNKIRGHDISYSLCFDNNGNLISADHLKREISVYNFQYKSLNKFDPTSYEFGDLRIIRAGPENEIYAELATDPGADGKRRFKLVKYFRTGDDYIMDNNFSIAQFAYQPKEINISPDDFIFLLKIEIFGDAGSNQVEIFDSTGRLEKQANPIDKTSNGTEFYFKTEKIENGKKRFRIINANSSAIMAQYEFERLFDFKLLCSTFDNKIIFRDWHSEKIGLENDFHLITKKPYFIVVDLESGLTTEIPTSECARDDYLYFNVSDVGCNYKGDLFAIVVYFNTPGEITGDEKIVFYRWRLK